MLADAKRLGINLPGMALNIGIRLDNDDVRKFLNAIYNYELLITYRSNTIPREQAIGYKHLLVSNIITGKVPSGYRRYNPMYKAWKDDYGKMSGYWKLAGDLVKNISYRPVKEGVDPGSYSWFSGIPSGISDSGGKSWFSWHSRSSSWRAGRKKEIAWYARIGEFGFNNGRQKHPPRPIFRPTFNEYVPTGKTLAIETFMKLRHRWK